MNAGFDSRGCDLQQEGFYQFTDKSPKELAFAVRNLEGVKRVKFLFQVATSQKRDPVPANVGSKDSLPWTAHAHGIVAEMKNGSLHDASGESVASFSLKYSLQDPGTGRFNNLGGQFEVVFKSGKKVAGSYAFQFIQ